MTKKKSPKVKKISSQKINWHLERRKLADLIPHPKNPREFTEKGMTDLENSIDSIGFAQPINISQDNVILSGHARVMKLMQMGYDEVDVYLPDCALTEKQEEEILVRMNANTAGQFDFDKLANEFEIDDLSEWGLELPDFEALELEETVGDDEVPEEPIKPITVRGDLYKLGRHRLLCGDSTMIDEVEKLMGGGVADMVFTDPPYNVGFNGRSGKHDVIKNDDLKDEDFNNFIENVCQIISALNVPIHYIWCNWKFYGILQGKLSYKACIVWAKNNFGMGNGYRHQHEFCLFNGQLDDGINNESDLWEIAKDTNYVHPTQKPVELSVRAFGNHKKAKIILDLFGGSGSTLIGAEKAAKDAYLMELDEKYCDVIIKRYIQFCEANNIKPSVKRSGEDCLQEFKK